MQPNRAIWRLLVQSSLTKSLKSKHQPKLCKPENVQSLSPARTRFAPSPTGEIHLGSLRTALYNYLLAKNTGGQFVLRLEDTDRKRLVPGAGDRLYEVLKWAGLQWDEGPQIGGPYGPYIQSERTKIYKKYAEVLLEKGLAYRCFCSANRLTTLADSARKLFPPSLASYDRKCSHIPDSELSSRLETSQPYVIRFKAPETYPPFIDELHGELSISPQKNPADVRYDDFVILKSDGMPTYHFANVVDDHEMKITHVVRGDEWLPSTPKHIALYDAFGWTPPKFLHLPLLTESGGRKLSKRNNSFAVERLKNHTSPSALVNFVALLGWYPGHSQIGESVDELLTMEQLIKQFSIEHLTKGNVQVDEAKLKYFDSQHFKRLLENNKDDAAKLCQRALASKHPEYAGLPLAQVQHWLDCTKGHISNATDFTHMIEPILAAPAPLTLSAQEASILEQVGAKIDNSGPLNISRSEAEAVIDIGISKGVVFRCLRKVLAGGKSGLSIVELLLVLGRKAVLERIEAALKT